MSNVKRRFKTDSAGRIPESYHLEPLTEYAVAPKTPPPARSMKSRDELISWVRDCVLGDLRTLHAGIKVRQADESSPTNKGLGGGNFLLAAGCYMALEYVARIFYGKEDALSNIRQYTKKFLSPINPRYGEICDLLWRSFRNGIIHSSWPEVICAKGKAGDRIVVGVGVDRDDPHLAPMLQDPRNILVVNAVQLLEDLERSVEEGFASWVRECQDDAVLERAGPRLLEINANDSTARQQLDRVVEWNRKAKGSG
jgi:hypothetical protein